MNTEAELLNQRFLDRVRSDELPRSERDLVHGAMDASLLVSLFESQLLSRLLDLKSRAMQAQGESFYTIGSAGHEGNAAIAAAFRLNDMALLHYRDAAFFIQRAKMVSDYPVLRDMLRSFAASKLDPISGGRHKVLGSKMLHIPPQTSTIASHLPKAVGLAASINLNKATKRNGELPEDGIVLCSFGDASLNHSTAQGAINTASWMAYQKMHLPIVFICEDNGIGISTPTPSEWVREVMQHKPAIHYFSCNGLDVVDTYLAACEVETYVRNSHKPAFLHMSCVRLMGHAGSDVQSTYLSTEEIDNSYACDPLLMTAGTLIHHGIMSRADIANLQTRMQDEIDQIAEAVMREPKLSDAAAVMQSLIPPKRNSTCERVLASPKSTAKLTPLPMGKHINQTLDELMERYGQIILAGEDIGRKGGVYGITNKLRSKYGRHRVIDTLLDEQSILGLGIGMAHNRLLPIVEIQFLAYVHNAEDQLRGEASTLSFFSQGQYTNPMVVRIAGLAYQKGFGGHFHNDNSIAALRDIPGMIIACPSNGADAAPMLREAVRLADEEQRVVIFLEPIALYNTRDLHETGDNGWCAEQTDGCIKMGEIGQYGTGTQVAIVTYGNGYYLSRQAEKILANEHGITLRVIDLHWLAPLPEEALLKAIAPCKHVLVVDECRKTGSLSEALMALFLERGNGTQTFARLCAEDSFIPLGRAATLTLPSKEKIIESVLKMCR